MLAFFLPLAAFCAIALSMDRHRREAGLDSVAPSQRRGLRFLAGALFVLTTIIAGSGGAVALVTGALAAMLAGGVAVAVVWLAIDRLPFIFKGAGVLALAVVLVTISQ